MAEQNNHRRGGFRLTLIAAAVWMLVGTLVFVILVLLLLSLLLLLHVTCNEELARVIMDAFLAP